MFVNYELIVHQSVIVLVVLGIVRTCFLYGDFLGSFFRFFLKKYKKLRDPKINYIELHIKLNKYDMKILNIKNANN